jgi:hypothetical protein
MSSEPIDKDDRLVNKIESKLEGIMTGLNQVTQ